MFRAKDLNSAFICIPVDDDTLDKLELSNQRHHLLHLAPKSPNLHKDHDIRRRTNECLEQNPPKFLVTEDSAFVPQS